MAIPKTIRSLCLTSFCTWSAILGIYMIFYMPSEIINSINSSKDPPLVDVPPSVSETVEHSYFLQFCAAVVIVVCITGLFGNVFTIVAIARNPNVRNITQSFIISLCISHLMLCCVNLPVTAAVFIEQRWIAGLTTCILLSFYRNFIVGFSLMTVAILAVNRCIYVLNAELYRKVYQTLYVTIMIAFSWILPFLMMIPSLLGNWGRFAYDVATLTCSLLDTNGNSAKLTLFVIGFVVPCLIVVVCYSCIFWVVRKSNIYILSRSNHPSIISDHRDVETKLHKEEIGMCRMVLFVCVVLFLCYMPIFVIQAVDPEITVPTAHIGGYVLLYVSACVNPIIYFITNKCYREAYLSILKGRALPNTNLGDNNPPVSQSEATGMIENIPLDDMSSNRTVSDSDNELVAEERV